MNMKAKKRKQYCVICLKHFCHVNTAWCVLVVCVMAPGFITRHQGLRPTSGVCDLRVRQKIVQSGPDCLACSFPKGDSVFLVILLFFCLTNVVHETEARPARSLTPNSWKALIPWLQCGGRESFQNLLCLASNGQKQNHTFSEAVASRAEQEGFIKLCWNADRQLPQLDWAPWGRAQAAAEIVGTLFANQHRREVPWHDMQVVNLRHCCAWTPGFPWCRDRLELGLVSYLIHLNTKQQRQHLFARITQQRPGRSWIRLVWMQQLDSWIGQGCLLFMRIAKDEKSTLEVLFKLSLLLYGPFPFFQASPTSEQAVLSSISTSVGTEGRQIGLHSGGTTMSHGWWFWMKVLDNPPLGTKGPSWQQQESESDWSC